MDIKLHQGAQRTTHHLIFIEDNSTLDHGDPPRPLFRRLHLGLQPRYKPSGCSSLSPTPLATDRCPPITGSHHGSPLRRPFSTPVRNQLFSAACKPFEAFARCLAILLLLPAFELLEESDAASLGVKGEYLLCNLHFYVEK
jgi:hypothetical protein